MASLTRVGSFMKLDPAELIKKVTFVTELSMLTIDGRR